MLLVCAIQSLIATEGEATNACQAQAFSQSNPLAKEASWRASYSHASPNGVEVPTSLAREAEMQKYDKLMKNTILGIGEKPDTPPIEFFAAEGVNMKYLNHTKGDTQFPTKIVLSNVGNGGLVKATVLVPVSGHTGVANAKAWAKTDTYTIKTDVSLDKDGKKFSSNSYSDKDEPQPNLVYEAKSLDVVTAQDIEVQLVKDKVVRIMYYRSGSGGPAGYFDGRVTELVWDGT